MNIRHDLVSCFCCRPTEPGTSTDAWELLQVFRAPGRYMEQTWQLVSGRLEPAETTWQGAVRELREETSLRPVELYQLDSLNTFFSAHYDTIYHAPVFVAIVDRDQTVELNHENTDYRWIPISQFRKAMMWAGERACFDEMIDEIINDGLAKPYMSIPMGRPRRSSLEDKG